MPHFSLKNIPECFKKGELYLSLIENDSTEDFELPEKHSTFAIDFKICTPTIKTIIYQLETVQFWCIYEIPFYVFDTMYYLCGKNSEQNPLNTNLDFSIFTKNEEFMYFLETYEYKKEIRYVLDIDTYEYHILVTCSIHGFCGYFKYVYPLLKQDCDIKSVISKKWALRSNNSLISMIVLCQKMAANRGHIDMLKILLQIHHCENLFPKMQEMAAEGGHIDCMKYLLEELSSAYSRIKWTPDTCHQAAKNGHLDCLKFAHENGAKWNYGVACAAAEYGHYDCYKYLHENGCALAVDKQCLNQHTCNSSCFTISANIHTTYSYCMWKHSSCNLAAANGHYECLKYGLENGSYITPAAIAYAAKYNHEKCIYYLVDREMASWNGVGIPYLSIVITFIIENNRFDILKTIYEKYKYCPFEPNHPNLAARTGNVSMVLYIIDKMNQQNSHYYDNICRNACRAPTVTALKKLRETGFPMGIDCLYAVSEKGDIETFKYVLDILGTNGVNPNIIYSDIVKKGDIEKLQYFYSFGFPIPIDCIIQCIIAGDYPVCVDYLYEKIQLQCDIAPICIYTAKHNRIQCLKRMHEKYRQPLENCLYWAIINNNIDMVKYVWEEEAENLTWTMYQNVVKKRYTKIRIFIEMNVDINELCRKHRIHGDGK